MIVIKLLLNHLVWFAFFPFCCYHFFTKLGKTFFVAKYLRLFMFPLTIICLILFFICLRDGSRYIVVFMIEGPVRSEWLAEQGKQIGKQMIALWLNLVILVSLLSLKNQGRTYPFFFIQDNQKSKKRKTSPTQKKGYNHTGNRQETQKRHKNT